MSPFAIDEERMTTDGIRQQEIRARRPEIQFKQSLDPMNPPVKNIPIYHFPVVLYKHPSEPYLKIEHRNTAHELVEVEVAPAEHLSQNVACREHLSTPVERCERCAAAVEKLLAEGWTAEPYIPKAAPDPNAHLYESRIKPKKSA